MPTAPKAQEIAKRPMKTPGFAVPRAALVAAGAFGVLMASSLWLWARHGPAVFHEMIVAGLALCF